MNNEVVYSMRRSIKILPAIAQCKDGPRHRWRKVCALTARKGVKILMELLSFLARTVDIPGYVMLRSRATVGRKPWEVEEVPDVVDALPRIDAIAASWH